MSRGIGPATRLPKTSTVPAVGVSRPPTMLSSVLLPQPDGPMRQRSSPRAMSNEVSSSARTWRASPSSPKLCETLLMRMAVSAVIRTRCPRFAVSLPAKAGNPGRAGADLDADHAAQALRGALDRPLARTMTAELGALTRDHDVFPYSFG